jgi:mRNA-degrading endonuclease YafQ of YafQ-DinJ toxin-antitoxin module
MFSLLCCLVWFGLVLVSHELRGDLAGVWSASASKELRITFERIPGGRKRLLTCSHHYAD